MPYVLSEAAVPQEAERKRAQNSVSENTEIEDPAVKVADVAGGVLLPI